MNRTIFSLLTIVLFTFSVPAFAQDKTHHPIRFGLQVAPQQTTVEELKEI